MRKLDEEGKLPVYIDGTQKIHTAAVVTPYADTGTTGSTAFSAEELAELLKKLNDENLDLHTHTVGERASRVVLDAVELARTQTSWCSITICLRQSMRDSATINPKKCVLKERR